MHVCALLETQPSATAQTASAPLLVTSFPGTAFELTQLTGCDKLAAL